jgi:hypothetical protein
MHLHVKRLEVKKAMGKVKVRIAPNWDKHSGKNELHNTVSG